MAGIVTPRAEGVPHPQITPGTPGAVRTVPVSHPQLSRPPEGLYDPAAEHDACGVAFVATLRGTPGRDIVDAALTALANLNPRAAVVEIRQGRQCRVDDVPARSAPERGDEGHAAGVMLGRRVVQALGGPAELRVGHGHRPHCAGSTRSDLGMRDALGPGSDDTGHEGPTPTPDTLTSRRG